MLSSGIPGLGLIAVVSYMFTLMTRRCMAVFKLVARFVWLIPIMNPIPLGGPATIGCRSGISVSGLRI